jgi:hypothetical protein
MVDAEFLDWFVAHLPRPVQLVVCGDFHQLSPVATAACSLRNVDDLLHYLHSARRLRTRHEERSSWVEAYDLTRLEGWAPASDTTPFGLKECTGKYAFQARAWAAARFEVVVLDQTYRTSDPVLIDALRAIRRGDVADPAVARLVETTRRPVVHPDGIAPTAILPLRSSVNAANIGALERLDATTRQVYEAKDSVRVEPHAGGWVREQLEKDAFFRRECPVDARLELRVGAQVVLLHNESRAEGGCEVNGSRGIVVGFSAVPPSHAGRGEIPFGAATEAAAVEWPWDYDASGDVYINRETGETSARKPASSNVYPVVVFVSGQRRLVQPVLFEKKLHGKGVCVREQLPIGLAWAMTVHKAQGASLDCVLVDLDGTFGDGQAYVAISRAVSSAGLEIRNFAPERITVHPIVVRFERALLADRHARFLRAEGLWWGSEIETADPRWNLLYRRNPTFCAWSNVDVADDAASVDE